MELLAGAVLLPYRTVLVDEVQDLTAPALKLLRTIAPEGPNSLYLVGDGHQRIYGRPVVMSQCGIEIGGRDLRLRLNYRTTQQIRSRAVAVLEECEIDDLDGGSDGLQGYHSVREGPTPEVTNFKSEANEASFILSRVKTGSIPVFAIRPFAWRPARTNFSTTVTSRSSEVMDSRSRASRKRKVWRPVG